MTLTGEPKENERCIAMKTIKTLVLATTMTAAGSAFAMSDPAHEYLKDNHLSLESTASSTVVQRIPVRDLDPATAYLVQSGLISAPTMTVETTTQTANTDAIGASHKYWEAPNS